ncbi:polysaccharide lyase [Pseudonocardia sp. CA-142604]|uniref:polysaccharide lyase n=1 Tax=Pseudonocardia sp. CA-142604 TaxID=3240024 RepID=UPI003D92D6C7
MIRRHVVEQPAGPTSPRAGGFRGRVLRMHRPARYGRGRIRGRIAAGVVAVAALAACQAAPPAERVTSVDPEVIPAKLQQFLGNQLSYTDHGDFGLDHAQLLTTTPPDRKLLRITYPAGSASRSAGGTDGGAQAYLELPHPTDALDLRYQLRFPAGFDFVKGGKLPGLYGGTTTSGQQIPDGTNGFSTRYMWRADGNGEIYAYLPTSRNHGTSLGRGCWQFTPGTWTTLRQRVQLNTPGLSNGRITVWQDDNLVLDHTGLRFRTTDQLRIQGLFFSTFFGGDDTTWATPTDQHTDFADFTLTTDTPPPDTPAPDTRPMADADCGTGDAS